MKSGDNDDMDMYQDSKEGQLYESGDPVDGDYGGREE